MRRVGMRRRLTHTVWRPQRNRLTKSLPTTGRAHRPPGRTHQSPRRCRCRTWGVLLLRCGDHACGHHWLRMLCGPRSPAAWQKARRAGRQADGTGSPVPCAGERAGLVAARPAKGFHKSLVDGGDIDGSRTASAQAVGGSIVSLRKHHSIPPPILPLTSRPGFVRARAR